MTHSNSADAPVLWTPDEATTSRANVTDYAAWLRAEDYVDAGDYPSLWAWSVADLDGFWDSIWRYFDVRAATPPTAVLGRREMPGAEWFPGATLNFAGHLLRQGDDDAVAMLSLAEDGPAVEWTWGRLRADVGALAEFLNRSGVRAGDRVVGYLPNCAEAVVAFLASASLGAVWAVCNQDVAVPAVIARLGQLEPKVLLTADGYSYGGKDHDRRAEVGELREGLPTVGATVVVPRLGLDAPEGTVTYQEATQVAADLAPVAVPFDHPLWVLFSSGTTGAPKGIVHGHGGVLLEHLKALAFHVDLHPDDRYFWYSSTSWMMWNYQVSGLLTGATIVLYDGSPNYPHVGRLWEIVAEHAITAFGSSAGYLLACLKAGLTPGADYDLSALRMVGSTGSPLPPEGFRWVHEAVGAAIPVASVSGGTDVVTAFIGHTPTLPVHEGEISGPYLGVKAEAWDDTGRPVVGEVGELVITAPMPSMPVSFWNDPTGARYRDAYFDTYPGVWRHGDWVTVTPRGSFVVTGRSDATLNRGGIRIGSAEIYAAVESLPQIRESLAVGVERDGGAYWLPLFVHLADGVTLDAALVELIKQTIRAKASPRHVPDEIIEVPAIPHTLTGKRLEVPVKKILLGADPSTALNLGSVDRPELLQIFVDIARKP